MLSKKGNMDLNCSNSLLGGSHKLGKLLQNVIESMIKFDPEWKVRKEGMLKKKCMKEFGCLCKMSCVCSLF